MVFVSVGNATQGFRRLLATVDRLAGEGAFGGERVVMQTGSDREFCAAHCAQQAFFPLEAFVRHVADASLVLCHAGAGTLVHVWRAGKVPVVMPRRQQYGEHVDDHQVELTRALAAERCVVPAFEPEDLPAAIAEARRFGAAEARRPPARLVGLVAEALDRLGGRRS